ncbi:hypothetical protein [Xanthomonas albilineans]|uniref:hypothetical protein n=1 Tax=Xanthomonas albilineans TaxID=29447 RepID=UPI000AE4EB87|nr:hypothetical protein [Xanthomonas albilineans]
MLILLSCVLVVGGVLSISNARKQLDSTVKVNVGKTRIGNRMVDANSSILIAMGTLAMVTRPELNPPALAEIKASRLHYEEFPSRSANPAERTRAACNSPIR